MNRLEGAQSRLPAMPPGGCQVFEVNWAFA
jgi:hypothetical protein